MIFQFSGGEFSDPIATSLKIWKKSIVLSLFAFSVTLDKLNRNPQAFPPPRPPEKCSFTHSSLAPPLENLLRGPCKRSVKMIDSSEKRNRRLGSELQNSKVCEKCDPNLRSTVYTVHKMKSIQF